MGLLPLAFFPLTMTPAILHSMLLMRVLHVLLSHVAACSWPGWLFGWKCAPGLSCLPRLVRLAGWLTGWLATSFSASVLFRTSMHIYGPWLAAKAAASAIFECHHHVHGPGRWSRRPKLESEFSGNASKAICMPFAGEGGMGRSTNRDEQVSGWGKNAMALSVWQCLSWLQV